MRLLTLIWLAGNAVLAAPATKSTEEWDEDFLQVVAYQSRCVAVYREILTLSGALEENTERCPEACYKQKRTAIRALEKLSALPPPRDRKRFWDALSVDPGKSTAAAESFLQHRQVFLSKTSVGTVSDTGEVIGDPRESFCAAIGVHRLIKAAIATAVLYPEPAGDVARISKLTLRYLRKETEGPPLLASHLLRASAALGLLEKNLVKVPPEHATVLADIIQQGQKLREQEQAVDRLAQAGPERRLKAVRALMEIDRAVAALDQKLATVLRAFKFYSLSKGGTKKASSSEPLVGG